MKPQIVFDTNVIVSFCLRTSSLAGIAFRTALMTYRPLASDDTLIELERVLARPKFDSLVDQGTRRAVFEMFVSAAERCPVTHTVTDSRDPTDNKFLALALSGCADLILTGDDDLLILHPWRSIPILSPAAFLAQHA